MITNSNIKITNHKRNKKLKFLTTKKSFDTFVINAKTSFSIEKSVSRVGLLFTPTSTAAACKLSIMD